MKKANLLLVYLLTLSFTYGNEVIDTDDAQRFQTEFDKNYCDINEGFEKVRHILLHLTKATGKMASYCEQMEHRKTDISPSQIINEVTPDLLFYALQLANHYKVDLGEKYLERVLSAKNRADKSAKHP